MTPLEKELDTELRSRYDTWQTKGYRAARFWQMLTSTGLRCYRGPVGTVKHLLLGEASEKSGFMRLRKMGMLDLTSEFEIQKAKSRLRP